MIEFGDETILWEFGPDYARLEVLAGCGVLVVHFVPGGMEHCETCARFLLLFPVPVSPVSEVALKLVARQLLVIFRATSEKKMPVLNRQALTFYILDELCCAFDLPLELVYH